MNKEIENMSADVAKITGKIRLLYTQYAENSLLKNHDNDSLLQIPSYYMQICVTIKKIRSLPVKVKQDNFSDLYKIGALLEKGINKLNKICEYLRHEYLNKKHDLADKTFYDNTIRWSKKAIDGLKKFFTEITSLVNFSSTDKKGDDTKLNDKPVVRSLITEPGSDPNQPNFNPSDSNLPDPNLIKYEIIKKQQILIKSKTIDNDADYPDHAVNTVIKDPRDTKIYDKNPQYTELSSGAFVKNVKLEVNNRATDHKIVDFKPPARITVDPPVYELNQEPEKNTWGSCFNFLKYFETKKVSPQAPQASQIPQAKPKIWNFTTADIPKGSDEYETAYEKFIVYKKLHEEGALSPADEEVYKTLRERFQRKIRMP